MSTHIKQKDLTFIDFLYLSTCTQTTIGYTMFHPRHDLVKILISIQLLLSIGLIITTII